MRSDFMLQSITLGHCGLFRLEKNPCIWWGKTWCAINMSCHRSWCFRKCNLIFRNLKCELESVTSCCSRLIQAIIQSTIIKVINPSRKNEVSSGCIRHCKNSMSRQQTHVSGIVIVFVWDGAQHYAKSPCPYACAWLEMGKGLMLALHVGKLATSHWFDALQRKCKLRFVEFHRFQMEDT